MTRKSTARSPTSTDCAPICCPATPRSSRASTGCCGCSPTSAYSQARCRAMRATIRELLQSPQEHLYAWLRSLDAETEGLPEAFVRKLRRALAYYGIDSLERTPALEAASYRLFLSQQAGRRRAPGDPGHPRPASGGGRPADRSRRRAISARRSTGWSLRSTAAIRSSPTSPVRSACATSMSRSSRRRPSGCTPRWNSTSPR